MRTILAIIAVSLALAVSSARADNIFGEFQRVPDTIERGFSVGGDFGLFFLLGDKFSSSNPGGLTYKDPGFALAFTTGYDILDWLAVEGVYTIGINEADPLDLVLEGGVTTFLLDGGVKLSWPLKRFYPFLEIGAGFMYSSPEFDPGKNMRFQMLMAAGFEYYTYLRHFSLYLKANYFYVDSPIDALTTAVGIKYTF